ncbi:MAG: hypothetical protein Q4D16_13090 [Eubacteriales bacterium]|nr:hypothetical protein [Eubacteriales bacterium]
MIADYMLYMMDYVVELNIPSPQMEKLNEIFLCMKSEELPVTREVFETKVRKLIQIANLH